MFLHRVFPNPRSRRARRDLADPYQMHATLCRVFAPAEHKCVSSGFLWRLEPELTPGGMPKLLIQSRMAATWDGVEDPSWFDRRPDPGLDLRERLDLSSVRAGSRWRYRLRANPCVTRGGKRLGLLRHDQQMAWLERQAQRCGFRIRSCHISDLRMLRCRQHQGNRIALFSALFDGLLAVTDPQAFRGAVENGVGHGKAMGLGLFSVVPVT